jgi:hypothetical protein
MKKDITDKTIKELVDAIEEHEYNRDCEWDFMDEHSDSDYWTDEQCEEHDRILESIHESHDRIQSLIRKITGNAGYNFP